MKTNYFWEILFLKIVLERFFQVMLGSPGVSHEGGLGQHQILKYVLFIYTVFEKTLYPLSDIGNNIVILN